MSASHIHADNFSLQPESVDRLSLLTGVLNANLRQLEQSLSVRINSRGQDFEILSESPHRARVARRVLEQLYLDTLKGALTPMGIQLCVTELNGDAEEGAGDASEGGQRADDLELDTPRRTVKPSGVRQKSYVQSLLENELTIAIGPAGTGKTYLAVAGAVHAWQNREVQRIVLTRPAVEAGEKLGFLPGDLHQKVDPYLRPLYDALYDTLGNETVGRLLQDNTIEVAPLAYMRGRTLNESFIIMDEAQNSTVEQMKMLLTRIGHRSRAAVTGDVTQIDLPQQRASGLNHAIGVLQSVKGVCLCYLDARDVMRNPLVQRLVEAYEAVSSDGG